MTLRTTLIASTLLATVLASSTAYAALQGRDLDGNLATFEAYYDTDLNITWLADANYAPTSGIADTLYSFNPSGTMNWEDANTWAANLSFTDGVNVYDDWRLPSTILPDASCGYQSGGDSYGYNCTGSEMGHLFYNELGGTAGQSILTSADPDLAKFANLQAYGYWSATEYAPGTGYYHGWSFYMEDGSQYPNYKSDVFYALAVSSGDVGAVPEAETYALMLAGLGMIGWRARRRG